ncbi:hypothetical protein ASPVEDRAFT_198502 [Aspergillus versicolor CBS 583.65]|uniref:Trimethyllysine dioxygenase n=1 Tax=Aspergillus versicolor CBS 583.65 TaxID=1036611 RepID=A0A1L9PVB7_ASPVE|nr:uncharacterized protein ASPVEDRAFT_198502 [Aspergillus versicolor CBS 583.65]OJJ05413.1 hypothetical protein ASPVEDRAFT_198502 [Aspergillus versicolor CBS 583.65]
MNRAPLSRALRLLRPAVAPRQHCLNIASRNVSTALRPIILDGRPHLSWDETPPRQLLRRNSSTAGTQNRSSQQNQDSEKTTPMGTSWDRSRKTRQLQHQRTMPIPRIAAKGDPEKFVILPVSVNSYAVFGKSWLRDNCRCPKCVHQDTAQRLVDIFSIRENIDISEIRPDAYGTTVTWSDGHVSKYSYYWLRLYHKNPIEQPRPPHLMRFREFDTYIPGEAKPPTVSYSEVMSSDDGVLNWLQHIYDWGFCFVRGTPVNPESTEALLKRIAYIRHTHYGGFWDFTADLTFKDTAYTNEFLGAHTDNTYFTDPARLQLFHLLSHTDGEGGANLLVDGFQAASKLNEENRKHALTLQGVTQPYHSSGNEDVCVQPAEHYPVFKVNSLNMSTMYQIRWNNYDRSVKWDWTVEEQEAWYDAAGHFNEIIHRPNLEIWTQLEPGTALIFDNWRMLHGRSAFTGKRRMCGGYINSDDFLSRYRLLRFGRKSLLHNLGSTKYSKANPYYYM